MKIVIDVEPGKDPDDIRKALRTMVQQVREDKEADPELDTCLELADPTGRALRAEIVGVVTVEGHAHTGTTGLMAVRPLEGT